MVETQVFYSKEDWYKWYLMYTEGIYEFKIICGEGPESFPCFAIIDHDPEFYMCESSNGDHVWVSKRKKWTCKFFYKASWLTDSGIFEVWDVERKGNRNLIEEESKDEGLRKSFSEILDDGPGVTRKEVEKLRQQKRCKFKSN